jgi:Acyl-CoA thioesterase C-terminal domain/Acyl-CoA thioesterase N-terminal domain
MSLDGVFVRDGDHYRATELALGPWYETALHGGAPAALLAHEVVAASPDPQLRLSRLTCEFVRPVLQGELSMRVEVVRPGRRVSLLDAFLIDAEGTEVTRARALLLRPSEVSAEPSAPPPFPGPEDGRPNDFHQGGGRPMFATHAIEIRFVEGSFREPGPATAWFRMRHPLVAGEPSTGLDLVAAAGDFGNGIASLLNWDEYMFINPEVTLYIEREPIDEWVALQSHTRVLAGSVAIAESVLWDREGRIGRATQALLVDRRR